MAIERLHTTRHRLERRSSVLCRKLSPMLTSTQTRLSYGSILLILLMILKSMYTIMDVDYNQPTIVTTFQTMAITSVSIRATDCAACVTGPKSWEARLP